MALSRRGQKTLPFLEDIGEYVEPPVYFPSLGRGPPSADVINLATAENWLLRDRLLPKFKAYISNSFTISDLSYVSGFGGAPGLLQGLADFFNDNFHPITQVVPDQIVTAPGASHLLDSVLYDLCNEGTAVLIQTPYWPGFDEALTLRNRLVATHVNVPFDDLNTNFFGPGIVDAYQHALNTSTEPVQALIICNPHNPIGGCYPVETLEELLKFAQRNDLHVVVDELYGLSVFDTRDTFHSVLSIDLARLRVDPWRVHVVYSFSKDLNSSGIRLGVFVTQDNHTLRDAIAAQQQSKLSAFTSVAATQLLQDTLFLKDIVASNPGLLRSNFNVALSFLRFYFVPFILPTAGVFVFAKFLITGGTVEEEQALEKKFSDHGVRINGGTHLHSSIPGYFRLIFAVERETLINGLHKIEAALGWSGWTPPSQVAITASSS
ncbi:Pyridoxal phosphate-dependent transferase [Amanita muscaria]